jgi:hypothetical protein
VTGRLIERDGARWYRIDGLERMEPFLTTVVSDSDLWLFASSAGPLTAGRVDADHAMLPYETDDRLHRAVERVRTRDAGGPGGPTDGVRSGSRSRAGPSPAAPARSRSTSSAPRSRSRRSTGLGSAVPRDLDAVAVLRLDPDRRAHRPRRAGAEVEVLDGLLDVLPAGVDAVTEQLTSNLVDSYKRSETGRWGTLAVYALESLITDRAEPAESLAATAVWSAGLDGAEVHLDERVVEDVRRGDVRAPVELLTGRRGAYLLHAPVAVPSGGSASWFLALDTGLGHAALHDRVELAADPLPASSSTTTSAPASVGSRSCSPAPTASSGPPTRSPTPTTCPTCCSTPCAAGCSRTATALPVADLLDFLRTPQRRGARAGTAAAARARGRGSRSSAPRVAEAAATTTSSGWCSSTCR